MTPLPAEGEIPMNPSLTAALSEFSKGRVATEPSNERPLHRTKWKLITRARLWLGKAVLLSRYLIIFFIGVVATLAWQSYGGTAREAIASWSPHLAWLAPAPAGTSPERFKATSLALAAVRQSVDKLATEVSKLQAQGTSDSKLQTQGTSDRTTASPSSRPGSRRL